MGMRQPTIYEVARAAGVSISTVSNVLNRPDRVGADTRARVLEAVDTLGYVPKADAVSKARRGMRRIAVLAPFTSYVSYLQRLAGVLIEAQSKGVEVAVFDHESAATASSPVLASMPIQGQVDGLIVMGIRLEEEIERRLFHRGVPTVVVDAGSDRFPVVACDDAAGGRMAAHYLLGLGHRRFGYLLEGQVSDYESQASRRLEGFRSELETLGTVGRLLVVETTSSTEDARSSARELLATADRPTAVMAHSDDLAVGAVLAAKDLGIDVPSELSVVGYDDGPMAKAADLTTIRQPFRESGAVAARLLFAAIAGSALPRTTTYLDVQVIRRSTSARHSVLAQASAS